MTEETSPKPSRLSHLMGWSVIGQGTYVLSQFALLIVLTWLAPVEDVGRFGLAGAIVVPICFLFRLNMRENQATDVSGRYRHAEFFRVQAVSMLIAIALIVLIAIALPDRMTSLIVLIFGAAKCVETFSDFFYGRFQRNDQMKLVAGSLILRGSFSTLLFSVTLWATSDVALSFLAHLVVWGSVVLFFDYPQARKLLRARDDAQPLRPGKPMELAREAFPLGINGLLAGLQGQIPRYMIGALIGVAALGQFTVVGYAIQAATTFVMALSQAMMTRLAQFVRDGKRQAMRWLIAKMIGILTVFGLLAAGVALYVGDWLLALIFGPDYVDLGLLLALCMLIATARSCVLIFQAGLFALRRFKEITLSRVVMAVLLVTATYFGASVGGLTGVAIAVTINSIIHAIILWIMMEVFLKSQTDLETT